MANVWGPNIFNFNVRLCETKNFRLEVTFYYDENYPSQVNMSLSLYPIIKNGSTFKINFDVYDISSALLMLQNILNGTVNEGKIIDKPTKKLFLRKESNIYRLYFIIPDNHTSFDMSVKEVYVLYNFFEMMKTSYFTLYSSVYAAAQRYIATKQQKKEFVPTYDKSNDQINLKTQKDGVVLPPPVINHQMVGNPIMQNNPLQKEDINLTEVINSTKQQYQKTGQTNLQSKKENENITVNENHSQLQTNTSVDNEIYEEEILRKLEEPIYSTNTPTKDINNIYDEPTYTSTNINNDINKLVDEVFSVGEPKNYNNMKEEYLQSPNEKVTPFKPTLVQQRQVEYEGNNEMLNELKNIMT